MFPEETVLNWFTQMAFALKYCHKKSVLHRDLKSENVFLTSDGVVKVGDFGLAKVLTSQQNFATTCLGTPYYMSPEVVSQGVYNDKNDVWALGVILYEMLMCERPFRGESIGPLIVKIMKGEYAPIGNERSDAIRQIVADCLTTDPVQRPSIDELLRRPFFKPYVRRWKDYCRQLLDNSRRRKSAAEEEARVAAEAKQQVAASSERARQRAGGSADGGRQSRDSKVSPVRARIEAIRTHGGGTETSSSADDGGSSSPLPPRVPSAEMGGARANGEERRGGRLRDASPQPVDVRQLHINTGSTMYAPGDGPPIASLSPLRRLQNIKSPEVKSAGHQPNDSPQRNVRFSPGGSGVPPPIQVVTPPAHGHRLPPSSGAASAKEPRRRRKPLRTVRSAPGKRLTRGDGRPLDIDAASTDVTRLAKNIKTLKPIGRPISAPVYPPDFDPADPSMWP